MDYLRDSEESSGAGPKSAHEVTGNRESSDASTTKSGGSGDDTLELLVHALVTVTSHDKTLVLQLLGNIPRARARHLDPGLGEDGACGEHVGDVHDRVNRVDKSILHVQRRRHVVDKTRDWGQLAGSFLSLPDTKQADHQVLGEAGVKHLRDEEDVGGQSRLEHNGHVGGVEQAHGVRAASSTLARGLDGDFNAEALQVNDGGEDDKSGQQVHDVGQVLSVKSLLQSTLLIGPGHQQVEEGNDGTLVFGPTAGVDAGRGEGFPHDRLADVGRDEQRNTTTETVSLLQKLVKENDNHASNEELEDQQNDDAGTQVRGGAIETSEDVDSCGTSGQDEGEQLLGSLVELTVGLEVEVDVNQVGSSQELEDHARGYNGSDTKLHQGSSVTRHHHAQPV